MELIRFSNVACNENNDVTSYIIRPDKNDVGYIFIHIYIYLYIIIFEYTFTPPPCVHAQINTITHTHARVYTKYTNYTYVLYTI